MHLGRLLTAITVGLTVLVATPAQASVKDTLRRMTLRHKVGQLVMFTVTGRSLSDHERRMIRRHHLGSVILFAKNYQDRSQLETLTEQIARAARRGTDPRIGALIAADQEGGIVKRFPDMPPHYSAPRLGEINKKSVAYDSGRATGRALRAAGVNVDLAPVGDLDIGPNRVMRERSFGSRRYRVARLALSFGKGLQAKDVVAAMKHFPGLGGATINTDLGRSYVYRTRRQLREIDAVPFHHAVQGGIRMMMISHAMYVNLGGQRPASFSYRIATKRLRKGFDFRGVAISDALEPAAWWTDGNVPMACKATVKAGVDIALITGGVDMAVRCANRIRRAVLAGKISKARLDLAAGRVLRLKRWAGLLP